MIRTWYLKSKMKTLHSRVKKYKSSWNSALVKFEGGVKNTNCIIAETNYAMQIKTHIYPSPRLINYRSTCFEKITSLCSFMIYTFIHFIFIEMGKTIKLNVTYT